MTIYVFNILFSVCIILVFLHVYRYQFCQIYQIKVAHFFDKEIAAYRKERTEDQNEARISEKPEEESITEGLREDPTPEEHKTDPIIEDPITKEDSIT